MTNFPKLTTQSLSLKRSRLCISGPRARLRRKINDKVLSEDSLLIEDRGQIQEMHHMEDSKDIQDMMD